MNFIIKHLLWSFSQRKKKNMKYFSAGLPSARRELKNMQQDFLGTKVMGGDIRFFCSVILHPYCINFSEIKGFLQQRKSHISTHVKISVSLH